MFGGSNSSNNNQQQNSRHRRAHPLRQQQRAKAAAGSDEEALIISGGCTFVCAILIVGAGALLATIFFSMYQPDCVKDIAATTTTTTTITTTLHDGNPRQLQQDGINVLDAVLPKEVAAAVAAAASDSQNGSDLRTGSDSSGALFPETAKFPPQCTDEQMDVLRKQLPPGGCVQNKDKPYKRMDCSFSAATNCGYDPVWLYEFHADNDVIAQDESAERFTAIYVGCNNAYDAMDMLQVASRDTKRYDRQTWRTQFLKTDNAKDVVEEKWTSDCPRKSLSVPENKSKQRVQAYLIEASPRTYQQLEKTKQALGYTDDELDLSHVAMALDPGTTRVFSNGPIGEHTTGIGHWTQKCNKFPDQCISVSRNKVDDWIRTKPNIADSNVPIHYMSITVEGSEYEVLQGSAKNLNRIHYLDLNYNWFGDWGRNNRSLKDLVFRLKKKGFVCYWPGNEGNMWRITDCFQEHYQLRYFANIACVNTNIPAAVPLAEKMEGMFLETLRKPSLQYGVS
jgi:hypothetical protein